MEPWEEAIAAFAALGPADPGHLRRRDRARARGRRIPGRRALGLIDIGDRAQRLRPPGGLLHRAKSTRRRSVRGPPCRRSSFARRESGAWRRSSRSWGRTAGEPVLVRQNAVVAATFHPELTSDRRLHRLVFARQAGAEERVSRSRRGRLRKSRVGRDPRRDRDPDPGPPQGQRVQPGARRRAVGGARGAGEGEGAGRGPRVLDSGHLLGGMGPAVPRSTGTAPRWRRSSPPTATSCGSLFVFGPPVVAALPGHAIAGGLIFAMAADERIAAQGQRQVRPLRGDPGRLGAGLSDGAVPARGRRAAHGAAGVDRGERRRPTRRSPWA